MNILDLAGIRAIQADKIVLKRKKVKVVAPRRQTRPAKKTLDAFVSALKQNGPLSRETIQLMMCVTKPFIFVCAKYLEEDDIIMRRHPDGKGPGKPVFFSLLGDEV